MAKILEVSVGSPRSVMHENKLVETAIFKSPVKAAVFASYSNLAGDKQADLSVHGGRDKAIYAYSREYYAGWARALGRTNLEPAQFGENLTVEGGRDHEIIIGDHYQIGDARVVVTQPRIPCFKLGMRLGDMRAPNMFWSRGELGFYLRVEKEGLLAPGDELILIERPGHEISIRSLWEILKRRDREKASKALSCLPHLDDGWRRRLLAVSGAD